MTINVRPSRSAPIFGPAVSTRRPVPTDVYDRIDIEVLTVSVRRFVDKALEQLHMAHRLSGGRDATPLSYASPARDAYENTRAAKNAVTRLVEKVGFSDEADALAALDDALNFEGQFRAHLLGAREVLKSAGGPLSSQATATLAWNLDGAQDAASKWLADVGISAETAGIGPGSPGLMR